jgi:lysozyme family protein
MMASDDGFQAQIARTLSWEGGYVDDPRDPGGETNFGISKRSYPDIDIRSLTQVQAIEIYARDFWVKPGLGKLPAPIGAKVFDLGVNMGTGTAIKLLQRACNACEWHPLLIIDGAIGPNTVEAANRIPGDRLLSQVRAEARNHYISIATSHPSLRRFLNGWLARATA